MWWNGVRGYGRLVKTYDRRPQSILVCGTETRDGMNYPECGTKDLELK